MPVTGREKSKVSTAWLLRNDYVQQNQWIPRTLRDEFSDLCDELGVTRRGVIIGLIETWCQQHRDLAAVRQEKP
jgi:hypothetical protein